MNITLDYIRSFRNGQTDAEIIGNAKQPGDEWFIDHHDTYAWYRAIGVAKQPQRILELGVRYGYSLLAMGAGSAKLEKIFGVDSEYDGIPSNAIAFSALKKAFPGIGISLLKEDTVNMRREIVYFATTEYGRPQPPYDIVHVDGNHSPEGLISELEIAESCIAADGWILVDDVDTHHVFKAAVEFTVMHEKNSLVIPTFHGMLLINMGSGNK